MAVVPLAGIKKIRNTMEEKIFLLEYEFNGSKWSLEFYAKDWEEAKLKLESLKKTIKLSGTLEKIIPIWETTIKNQQN